MLSRTLATASTAATSPPQQPSAFIGMMFCNSTVRFRRCRQEQVDKTHNLQLSQEGEQQFFFHEAEARGIALRARVTRVQLSMRTTRGA
jgi:hypothetical protein